MADNLCTVEANGTTFSCACGGCGIAYNHDTKKYHILCCGSITEMKAKNQTDDEDNPPRPGQIIVDLKNVTALDAAKLLDRAAPGKVKISGTLKQLDRRVTFKSNQPLSALVKRLKLPTRAK